MKSRILASKLRTAAQIEWALFRRWLYLLFIGMWRGECAYQFFDKQGRYTVIASERAGDGAESWRVWWRRDDLATQEVKGIGWYLPPGQAATAHLNLETLLRARQLLIKNGADPLPGGAFLVRVNKSVARKFVQAGYKINPEVLGRQHCGDFIFEVVP
ncbi:MAG: hypothetical protein V4607_02110 [Pseudomonadota bacterium]